VTRLFAILSLIAKYAIGNCKTADAQMQRAPPRHLAVIEF
jgi:hypothetical protein